MGKASRDKGKRGEVEIAAMLRAVYPEVRTKRAGGESASVDRGRDLLGTPGMCVQVKCMAAPRPIKAHHEAARVALPSETAVAFCKQSQIGKNCYRWTATLDAADFIALWRMAKGGSQEAPPPSEPLAPVALGAGADLGT